MADWPQVTAALSQIRRFVASAATAFVACMLTAASAWATGVVSGFSAQPATTNAAVSPDFALHISLLYTQGQDTVKDVRIMLPPGMWLQAGEVAQRCSDAQLGSNSCPLASYLGTGRVTGTYQGSGSFNDPMDAYLSVAPSPNDAAGVGLIVHSSLGQFTIRGTLDVTSIARRPVEVLNVLNIPDLNSVQSIPTGISLTLNGKTTPASGLTANGPGFVRLPTTCGLATTTVIVDTYAAANDGSASDSFTPTGCANLPFSPTIMGSFAKDARDAGVAINARLQQALGQAGVGSATLGLPTGFLNPDSAARGRVLCSDPSLASCRSVGSAVLSSPAFTGPLAAKLYLAGRASAPTLVARLPPPWPFALQGAVSPANRAISWAGLPDVPISSLLFTLAGGTNALFTSDCATDAGTVSASFTSLAGQTFAPRSAASLTGCSGSASRPSATRGTLTGLATGRAHLSFTLHAGRGPKIKSVTITPPSGLSFNSAELGRGLSLGHAVKFTDKLKRQALVITLKNGASGLSIAVGGRAISVSSGLKRRAKGGHFTLSVAVTVTDVVGRTTKLRLSLRV